MIFSSKWGQRLIQKISIVFGIDCPFYIYCRCRNCPVTLRNKLSFRKQTRPDNLSFWNDRKYDCHFQSTKKKIPILWKRMGFTHFQTQVSLSYRRESYQSSRSDSQSIIFKSKLSSFRKDSNHHFEEKTIVISKRQPILRFETTVLPAINHPLV